MLTVAVEATTFTLTMTKKGNTHSARFAAGVRSRRAELDLTQDEVAQRAGINRSYLSLVERGKATTTVPTACRLAEALETTVGALLGEPKEGNR